MISTSKHGSVIGSIALLAFIGGCFAAYQAGGIQGTGWAPFHQPNMQPAEVHTVLGTVVNISGRQMTLTGVKRLPDVAGNPVSEAGTITVLVGAATEIERLVPKTNTAIAAEMAAFSDSLKKMQAQGALSTTTPPAPPLPFTRSSITLGDIRSGDIVAVSAAENIAGVDSFTATKIQVQTAMSALVAPKAR